VLLHQNTRRRMAAAAPPPATSSNKEQCQIVFVRRSIPKFQDKAVSVSPPTPITITSSSTAENKPIPSLLVHLLLLVSAARQNHLHLD
jgi:hypothetical protein